MAHPDRSIPGHVSESFQDFELVLWDAFPISSTRGDLDSITGGPGHPPGPQTESEYFPHNPDPETRI